MPLSAVVITYNEETNIEACLKSISWVDEIVVVDAMSTDRTRELAGRFATRVLDKPWEGYVEARDYAISEAKHDWVISIDADERIPEELRAEIEAELVKPEYDGYLIPRKAFFLGRWIKHCGWYPGYVLRLFRKANARVTQRKVHEGIRVDGRVGTLRHAILHYTYPSIRTYFGRFESYTSLAADELYEKGRKASLIDLLLRPFFQFMKMYVVRSGFLDGYQGFLLCAFSAFYVFVKYSKLRELHEKGGGSDASKRRNIR
jgi:glycosyltransferase involved in cell wall biosynthesis